ncbi:universal stress protein, partial [Akkermansiaceae bacterium]|nr:universal stress protein [Akkermansiaceae bacterium]
MKPYKHILVGINYTDASRHALLKAEQIARSSGGKLTACHVVMMPELDEFTAFYSIEHQEMMKAAQSSLEGFVKEVLGENHSARCVVSEGIPHYEIVSLANDGDYDLLVLGDDDHADDSKKSAQFAIKCLRFATMPTLLVNRPHEEHKQTIAACIDFSNSTNSILAHAAHFAAIGDSAIDLIHACRPPWLRPERLRYQTNVFEDQGQKEQFREILQGQLAGIRQSASSLVAAEITTTPIEDENPVHALIQHLSDSPCGLVVIGRVGKGLKGIVSDFLGGTAETIIRHVHHPILI